MTYVIGPACADVQDRTCITECPVDCIYEADDGMFIHPDECVECGACEPACPVSAIAFDAVLPSDFRPYADAARRVADEIGEPQGARRSGPLAVSLSVETA